MKKKYITNGLRFILYIGLFVLACFVLRKLFQNTADPDKLTKQRAERIVYALQEYKAEHSNYVKELSELLDSDDLLDQWGRPFVYVATSNSYMLFSKGEDGVEGTKDDIIISPQAGD